MVFLSKPDSSYFNSFTLSWVDKITPWNFVSATANFACPVVEEILQSSLQVRLILVSQLIEVISRVIQKLFNYFNGTAILPYFELPLAGIFLVILNLDLDDLGFTIAAAGSSL